MADTQTPNIVFALDANDNITEETMESIKAYAKARLLALHAEIEKAKGASATDKGSFWDKTITTGEWVIGDAVVGAGAGAGVKGSLAGVGKLLNNDEVQLNERANKLFDSAKEEILQKEYNDAYNAKLKELTTPSEAPKITPEDIKKELLNKRNQLDSIRNKIPTTATGGKRIAIPTENAIKNSSPEVALKKLSQALGAVEKNASEADKAVLETLKKSITQLETQVHSATPAPHTTAEVQNLAKQAGETARKKLEGMKELQQKAADRALEKARIQLAEEAAKSASEKIGKDIIDSRTNSIGTKIKNKWSTVKNVATEVCKGTKSYATSWWTRGGAIGGAVYGGYSAVDVWANGSADQAEQNATATVNPYVKMQNTYDEKASSKPTYKTASAATQQEKEALQSYRDGRQRILVNGNPVDLGCPVADSLLTDQKKEELIQSVIGKGNSLSDDEQKVYNSAWKAIQAEVETAIKPKIIKIGNDVPTASLNKTGNETLRKMGEPVPENDTAIAIARTNADKSMS